MSATVRTLLPEISHGDHCCLFFSTPEEQARVTVPFLGLGLERDERSVFVGTPADVDRMREALVAAGVEVERETGRGRLSFVSDRDYLDGGHWRTEKMLAFLQAAYDRALGEGYTALRAAGDISWQVGPDRDFRDVVYYETLLDVFFVGKRMVGMCQYPKAHCPAEVLSGILACHKIAAIDQEVCQNVHYLPAGLLLERDPVLREEKRIEWMTSQLLRLRRAEEHNLRLSSELEERVRARTAELETANRDLEAYAHTLAHDLAAPLRSMTGFAEILKEDCAGILNLESCGYLERIIQSSQLMKRMVEDLLALAKVSKEQFLLDSVPLSEVLKESLEQLDADLKARNAMVVLEGEPLPKVRANRTLLGQVVSNLLSNASKFVAPGIQPRIRVRADRAAGTVRLWVADNGIGIAPEYHKKIFGVFQRLHSDAGYAGSGIGLALVERGVERMGGRVGLESEPGTGSRFWIELTEARN